MKILLFTSHLSKEGNDDPHSLDWNEKVCHQKYCCRRCEDACSISEKCKYKLCNSTNVVVACVRFAFGSLADEIFSTTNAKKRQQNFNGTENSVLQIIL